MKYGYVRLGAASPEIKVANCTYNADRIIETIQKSQENECDLLVFPELCVTGYTCGDLFLQNCLLRSAEQETLRIAESTKGIPCIVIIGLPVAAGANLYNAAAVIYDGNICGIVPKQNIPNYSEFYEMRHFTPYQNNGTETSVFFGGAQIPCGRLLFDCTEALDDFKFGIEICEDLWTRNPPSGLLAEAGALILCNLSASNEIVGKREYRKTLAAAHSGRNICTYLYSDAGTYESTSDMVFSGHKFIYENASLLAESELFEDGSILFADTDLEALRKERRALSTFTERIGEVRTISIPFKKKNHKQLLRCYKKTPFVPSKESEREHRCAEVLNMQAYALRKRLVHTNANTAVIGLSGGLDSTLALLVTARAFDIEKFDRKRIRCITMPCFGTTDRTYQNACRLCEEIGATLEEIDIKESVLCHFKDIGQNPALHDVTYENAQARERTQVLMDYANKTGGIVIGTGDLSELALGWATYNGDHMSMYAVNASIPKTLVRYLVKYYADISGDVLKAVLYDILDTPVSPELIPPQDGKISQKTEDLVGPYELHDFFLYYFQRYGFSPDKIYFIAKKTFRETYGDEVILKWLRIFLRRFFMQQFKRSCMPDGPKVGTVSLSPRGDLRMPSDADPAVWLADLSQYDF